MENEQRNTKNRKIAFLFGIILSLTITIGREIYHTNDITVMFNFKEICISLVIFVVLSVIIGGTTLVVFKILKRNEYEAEKTWKFYNLKSVFFIMWIIIFLSWMPAFLAYYPGIMSYDSDGQTVQAIRRSCL